ncbi:MAG: diguanylate cyclase [Solirubrobacteraceae bacterium]
MIDGRRTSNGFVVVVDDHESVRMFLEEVLRKYGFHVVGVGSGRAAIETVDGRVETVLLDLGLPDMPGLDVLDAVRSMVNAPPVIVLTGSVDRDAPACLSRGAHDFMLKPPQIEELVARVSAAVRVKRLQDDLHNANALLSHQALTDALTGLANRRHGFGELDRTIASAERHDRTLCVLMCDLDHFKTLNDAYGHDAGDSCLRETARRLASAVRTSDVPVRWGGEEFVVLMPDAVAVHAAEVAERIRAEVADPPFFIGDDEINVTMSVGWAMRGTGEAGADLVARADGALYEAKRSGRNAVIGAA